MTGRAFIDLHCHTSASFDSLAKPADVAHAAHARGLTHLIVTDHDRIDGALAARAAAPPGLTVIVGEEVRTADGDHSLDPTEWIADSKVPSRTTHAQRE